MFATRTRIAPPRLSKILAAAEAAARAVPPAFPLDATVAVNPFLGQINEDLATAAARLARVAGCRATRTGAEYAAAIRDGLISDEDLKEALLAAPWACKPADIDTLRRCAERIGQGPTPQAFPTIADLAAEASGIDWPALIDKCIGLWAAGHFDRGQALWSPAPGSDAFTAWRGWAMHDLTPEIAGLKGFCAHVAAAPDTAERAILACSEALSITEAAAETIFHRLFCSLGGWSQHARWLLWEAERAGETDCALADLLAIRLIWEAALLQHAPAVIDRWEATVAAHAAPITPGPDDVALAILQDAADRGYQRRLAAALPGGAPTPKRPLLQTAFCIDVRSEVFRRALESVDSAVSTIGFAGFFGLPLAHHAHGSDVVERRLPVLLNPTMETSSSGDPADDQTARIACRSKRAWGRFRQAAVSSFAFVEAMGPIYAVKLLRSSLGLPAASRQVDPAPEVIGGMSAETTAETGAAILKAMSLTKDLGEIVLLLGHGANLTNNPHESAYHCGACGGYPGDVSARLLAILLNDPETRAGLGERGVCVPENTLFLAGLHDTTTDAVTLFDADLPVTRTEAIEQVRCWLNEAAHIARAERAIRLPGAKWSTIRHRATNWAEIRPEWGLAGCAAFIAAPRGTTAGRDLGGRAFLHSYDWQADHGFGTLELILTAPVVVASWISLQYYGSSVAPDVFGGGNKLIHNVIGGIGVVEGNGGRLRAGLPWQAVHDGVKLVHEPLRLSVLIEAPKEAITAVLERHASVRALFDNGWLHLLTLRDGKVEARYRPGLAWDERTLQSLAA